MNYKNIKNILVISLTSIGDVILTLPVVDVLRQACPQAKITLTAGPKAAALFRDNPLIDFVAYDKRASLGDKLHFIRRLRQSSYDLIVDLRNTAIPFLVRAKYRTPLHRTRFTGVHIKDTHMMRLRTIWNQELPDSPSKVLVVPEDDRRYVESLLNISEGKSFVTLCPGAANAYKRWPAERFAALADRIIEEKKVCVVFVAGPDEKELIKNIISQMKHPLSAINLAGQTDLLQSVQVFLESRLVIANDSGPMHLASYLDVSTIGIFGYSDPAYARPWGKGGVFIRKNQACAACRMDEERLSSSKNKRHIAKDGCDHTCLQAVQVEDVWMEAAKILNLA